MSLPGFPLLLTLAGILGSTLNAEPLVGMARRDFVDNKRLNWMQPGKPRPLSTWVWYPAAPGSPTRSDWGDPSVRDFFPSAAVAIDAAMAGATKRFPLVVMSHGTQSLNLSLMWLGTFLASKGFVVAAVNHHGNTGAEPKLLPQGFVLASERVKDLSVLIDQMLADPMFGPRIDVRRIAAVGHSAGGATVIQLAGGIFDPQKLNAFCVTQPQHSDCQLPPIFSQWIKEFGEMAQKDPALRELQQQQTNSFRDTRVRAIVSLAPAVGQAFDAQGLRSVKIPVQIVVGSADTITPPDINADHYAKLIRGAKLIVIPNSGHMVFGSTCTEKGKEQLSVVCKDEAGVDREDVHRKVQQLTSDFLNSTFRTSSIRR